MKLPFINRFIETRAAPIDEKMQAFMNGEDLADTRAGLFVSEEFAMRTSDVYACVCEYLLKQCLPLPLYKRLSKEKATYHPLYSLLYDVPNHEMTSFSFREMMMVRRCTDLIRFSIFGV